ncbi:S8 family serine peptidase [Desulfovibrio gilichinskyi]|uniref:Subtilase family protein n=1 Tax=Desulfovibrio gilichinskyi TaxID=1519643 RepID=A0A1X7E714_9BACT|nr:S8 family serine peptidase [Desulfovibrio gilichinskyi]SMF28704.1 Subtilase family protein [Desulfovibrio gilichinskyi]
MRQINFAAALSLFVILTFALFFQPSSAHCSDIDTSAPKLFFQNKQVDPLKGTLGSTMLPSNDTSSSENENRSSSTPSLAKTIARIFSSSDTTSVEEYDYYVVQFSGPVQPSWKEALSGLGAVFFDYIPQYAFIIKLGNAKVDAVSELGFVRWIGKYDADLKLSRDVYDISPEKLKAQESILKVRVVAFPGEDINSLVNAISSAGGTVVSSSSSTWSIRVEVKISIKNVRGLKNIKGVKWVERVPEHHTNNNIATGIVEARSAQGKTWPVSGGNLFGEGQIIAVCDSGIDTGNISTIHKDFSDGQGGSRIIDNIVFPDASAIDYLGHGTHVAGTIAGNGIKSGASPLANVFPSTSYAGMAPKSKLFFETVGSIDIHESLKLPPDLADIFQLAYDAGARVHSNSWGSSGTGDYDSECVSVDQFTWTNKDFLILFAAGNEGSDKDADGVIDHYCIGTPASAKNCLTVGASESYRTGSNEGYAAYKLKAFGYSAEPLASDFISDKPYGIAAFSSRGPTLDGRYKPEVVAPGTNILSTRSSAQLGNAWGAFNEYYYWSGGTSMATPLVSGMAAIMREYLMKEEGFTAPSAALIKTSLIHGAISLVPGQYGTGAAQEITGVPDDVQGWGRVDLESSINSDSRYKIKYYDIKDSAPADTTYSRTFSFDVKNDQKPFKAVLGWTDYPGSVAASGGLVNDLDLRVKKPDGTWLYPDNARSLSPLTKCSYVTEVSDSFYTGNGIGVRVTPPSYPCTLESVVLAFANSGRVIKDVSVVIYRYAGGVGAELFRKKFAYIPSGEYAFPIGLSLTEGEVLVAVEKDGTAFGVNYDSVTPTSRGFIQQVGGSWEVAAFTPAIGANFRTNITSTGFDRLNNSVSVTIPKPQIGTYQAEITANNIPNGPQPYALILSGMVGENPTNGEIALNADQPNAPISTFLSKTHSPKTAENINAVYGTALENVYSDKSSFCVQTEADRVISIQYSVSGLPAVAAGKLALEKLFSNGTHIQFKYAAFEDYTDGNWWLTDVSGNYVNPVQTLNSTTPYYVISAIKDGGAYDENPDSGVINDPQILGMSSPGSGGTGCTVGMNDDYGPVLFLLIAIISLLLRRKISKRLMVHSDQ